MRPLTVLVPFALAAGFAMPAIAQEAPRAATITVEGQGEVLATPDTAIVTSGVTTDGATAREALDANTKAMAELVAALKEAGIEPKDIQTSNFSVNPQYIYSDQRNENGYTLPPKISGYQVYNGVNVRVRKLADLGTILDKMVTVGANTIGGVSFSVAETGKLLDEARKAAFADAKSKAEVYGGVAELTLGRIASIQESTGYGQPQPYMMKAEAAYAGAAPVPVEAGQISYTVNVSVQWEVAGN